MGIYIEYNKLLLSLRAPYSHLLRQRLINTEIPPRRKWFLQLSMVMV